MFQAVVADIMFGWVQVTIILANIIGQRLNNN